MVERYSCVVRDVHILRARPQDATCLGRKCLSGGRAAVARETLARAWISLGASKRAPRMVALLRSLTSELLVPCHFSSFFFF